MLYIGLLHALFFLTTPAESATADRTAHTRDLGGQKRHPPRGGVVVWECISFCVRQMPASTWRLQITRRSCVIPPVTWQLPRKVLVAEMEPLPISAADALVFLIERVPEVESIKTALKTCAIIVANAADPAKGVLKTTNAGLQKRILSLEGGEAVLVSLGFVADAAAGTLTWDASLSCQNERATALQTALNLFEAIAAAVGSVGDTNAPAPAREALKLIGTYVGNIGAQPDAPERRRINASNKALGSRLLSCKGGSELLLSCGFTPEPASGEPEAYVCGLDWAMVRVAFATLEKAPAIWGGLAASRGGGEGGGGEGGGSEGGGGLKMSTDKPAVALDNIKIAGLHSKSDITKCAETRDMQPALCKSDDGIHVLLLTYQCASRAWMQQGSMEIPGGDFKWELYAGAERPCMAVLVDLGDAHGTGEPVMMRVPIEADGTVNEYVSARDFISEQEAEAYKRHKEPVLNMNWLEEVARKVRAAAEPVLLTVERLKAAMIDQH